MSLNLLHPCSLAVCKDEVFLCDSEFLLFHGFVIWIANICKFFVENSQIVEFFVIFAQSIKFDGMMYEG